MIRDSLPLQANGRNHPFPFGLVLSGTQSGMPLVCLKMLRFLPGKRAVCYGKLDDHPVAVKIFFSKAHARRHADRDEKGVKALLKAQLPTPEILFRDRLADDGSPVLVFTWVKDAVDLKLAIQDETRDIPGIIDTVAGILGRMHEQGLYQTDIHPGNFLVRGNSVQIIDGDAVRCRRGPLAATDVLPNLGLFLAQFNGWSIRRTERLLSIYSQQREGPGGHIDRAALERWIARQHARRERKYLAKVMRACSAFVCRRSRHRWMICDRRFDSSGIRRLLENPDGLMAAGTMLKDGNSATVMRLNVDGHDLVAKRYNIKGPRHLLRRCLRESRAALSWKNAHHLLFLGIATPLPVGFAETRHGPFRSTALFVMRYQKGRDLYRHLHDERIGPAETCRLVGAFCDLQAQLADNRISHGDFKATNFIVTDDGLSLIDLDAMVHHRLRWRHRNAREKDLGRFLRNWEDRPEILRLFRQNMAERGIEIDTIHPSV